MLAVCSLERGGKVELQRSDKYPEAVDLASLRLGEGVEAGAYTLTLFSSTLRQPTHPLIRPYTP